MILGLNAVDWLVILLVVVVAYTGWSHGLLVGLLSFVGFVGGAAGGLLLVPVVLGGLQPGVGVSVLAVMLVLTVAVIGQGLLAWGAGAIRARVHSEPAHRFDAAGGAVLAVVGLLLAAWAVGLAISSAAIPQASAAVRESKILRAVDRAVPVSPDVLREAFESVVAAGRFPEVVGPWVPEPIVTVDAPSAALSRDPEIREASASVVKILGRAPSCDRVVEGTGFVVAPERVMTNAHVVAGVSAPVVTIPDGDVLDAWVVLFDPRADIAVLAVPGLDRPALSFRDELAHGADAAVVGYPDNGPLSTEPVRIRGEHALLGRDIYGEGTVNRDVISIRGTVRPGNSGGPLVADDGRVYGVVFAASLTDPETGYALDVGELGPALEDAPAAVEAVPTSNCT
ncbi:MAG TPA: MarP family serine protease [Jiangellaceae bacterium]